MNFELDTKALRYFAAVAERGSFLQAATHLRITQPAVSRQIQAIEKAYGVRLFRQQGRKMVLTEAGQLLLQQSTEILTRLDELGSSMRTAAQKPTGRISIGVTSSPAEILMPDVIQRYSVQHPDVFVHIVQGSSAELKELLMHGELDLALIYGQPAKASVSMQPLLDLHVGLVAPAKAALKGRDPIDGIHAITLEKIASLPLIFPGRKELMRSAFEQAFSAAGVTPTVILESESLLLSKALIKTGMGYMLIGYVGVHEEVQEGSLRFIPLAAPGITWRLSLATRGTKAPSLAVKTMADEIMDAIKRGGQDNRWQAEILF